MKNIRLDRALLGLAVSAGIAGCGGGGSDAASTPAPADQTGLVTALTTLVQQTVAMTGASTAAAVQAVQDATGITASPLDDYTKAAAPTDGSTDPAQVARLVVLAAQSQGAAIAGSV